MDLTKTQIILEGNALDLFKKYNDKSIDLIIADPPYNLGKDYGNDSDSINFEDYLKFSRKWISEAYRVLKDNGTIYIFMGVKYISYIYVILEQDFKMNFNSWITWHYTQGIGKTKGFSPRHDDILMFTKSNKFIFNLDDVRVPQKYYRNINNMRGANPGNVWNFSHIHYCNENRKAHPTQKPEGIIERIILASSNEDSLIIDPFAGSGTTLRVAQQLNRNAIGFEINPEYIKIIKDRLDEVFYGFDSIDPIMKRIPLDINDENLLKEYIENHKKWFLKNHQNEKTIFEDISDKQKKEKPTQKAKPLTFK